MGILTGKRALIVGLISDRSIASGIAEAMHREGAELAFTYQNEKFKDRVEGLASAWNSKLCFPCDVSEDSQIKAAFEHLKSHWDEFDILVHSVAYAPADQLEGDYLTQVSREGFRIAHDVSSYSLAALAQTALPMMQARQGAIVTMTYLGSTQTFPNYNVMGVAKASLEANVRYLASSLGPKGIRVNAVSAGPIRTLAASGIKHFRKMLDYNQKATPLRQNVTTEQVGNAAAFLCSDLASGITGEILHVDAGFNIVGMPDLEI
jgi:enoyl-[acyl-carrier protein] reductase I